MNHREGLPIFELGQEFENEQSNKLAWKIIENHFHFYQSEGTTAALWELVVEIMSSDSENITGRDRNNVIFFYEYMVLLNKAAFYLCEQKRAKIKSSHSKRKRIQ